MGQTFTENDNPMPEQLALRSTEKLAITAPPTHPEGTSRVLQNLLPGTITQDQVRQNKSVCRMYPLGHRSLIIYRVLIWRNY